MVDEADELYGLPDDEFTAARDALAKRLRAEKRREQADEVKALRRPNVAAGAINRAVREHGADDLLAAGEALREAHEALLSGAGDAAAVREATAREREAVRAFARLALGEDATASTDEKVRATLHAASVDDDVRALLEAGRLERDAEAGADPMALLAAGATKSRGSGATKAPAKPRAKSGGAGTTKSDRSAASKSDRSARLQAGALAAVGRAAAAGEGGRACARGRRPRADRSGGGRDGVGARPRRARGGRGGRTEGARGRRGPGGARAGGPPRGQGGRGRGRAPPHRGAAGGQGRRVARLTSAAARSRTDATGALSAVSNQNASPWRSTVSKPGDVQSGSRGAAIEV